MVQNTRLFVPAFGCPKVTHKASVAGFFLLLTKNGPFRYGELCWLTSSPWGVHREKSLHGQQLYIHGYRGIIMKWVSSKKLVLHNFTIHHNPLLFTRCFWLCLTILEAAPCHHGDGHNKVMTLPWPGEDPAVALLLSLPAPPNADQLIAPKASGKAPIAALQRSGIQKKIPSQNDRLKYPLRTLTQNDITSNHESCELKSTYLLPWIHVLINHLKSGIFKAFKPTLRT